MLKFILSLLIPLSLCAEFYANQSHIANATHIIMVRHGETDRNAEGKQIQGWIDDEAAQLNEKGQMQADQLGKILSQRYLGVITAIYSSPLGRCMQTAQEIAKYFHTIPVRYDRRFMEICHGQYDTMSFKERNAFCIKRYAELEREFKEMNPDKLPDRFLKWSVNPLAELEIPLDGCVQCFEGLETILQLFKRATDGCDEIGKKHPGETILLSSHAALIKTMADEAEYRQRNDMSPLPAYYEPRSSLDLKSQYLPGNCSVYHFIWDEGKLTFVGTENLLNGSDAR